MIALEGLSRNNFVFSTAENTMASVEEIYSPKQQFFSDMLTVMINGVRYSKFLDLLEYINIDVAWLEMLGFRKGYMSNSYEIEAANDYVITVHLLQEETYLTVYSSTNKRGRELVSRFNLKYVHELQNTYFLLTKTQLRFDASLHTNEKRVLERRI